MKRIKLFFMLPLLLLTSCEESLTIGVHFESGENVVHYACSSVMAIKGGALRIRTKGNITQFISGNYATYRLPSACPICGYEGDML